MIVRYSDTAKRQLNEIWRFSRRHWGEARADKYVSALYNAVRLTAEGKKHVRPRPELHPGVCMVRSGSHSIYFTLEADPDVLHVVAILHQRMEPRRRIRKAIEGN